MRKILILALFIAGAVSCIYPYDPGLEGTGDDIVVVEGNIVIGGTSTARLSRVIPFTGGLENALVTGSVVIEDDAGEYYRSLSTRVGSTFEIPTQNAPASRKYRMRATVGGMDYVSDWLEALDPPEIEDVSFTADEVNVYVCVSMKGGGDATGYVGLTYDETWEFHSEFTSEYELDTLRWVVSERTEAYPNYWCWRSSSTNTISLVDFSEMEGGRVSAYPFLSFLRVNNRNHRRYSILVKARTLPKEAYRYLKNLDEISTGDRSLFTPNPGEVPSNLRCESDPSRKVLGYVTAGRLTSKRVFLDDRYRLIQEPSTEGFQIPESRREFPDYYHQMGYYPIAEITDYDDEGREITGIGWGPLRCIDCIADGGTKEKPDFWE